MATLPISQVNLTYKKHSTSPLSIEVNISLNQGDVFLLQNLPDYLIITGIVDISPTSKRILIGVDPQTADTLTSQIYNVVIGVWSANYSDLSFPTTSKKIEFYGPIPGVGYDADNYHNYLYTYNSSYFHDQYTSIQVTLDIQDSVLLSASPETINFSMLNGAATPGGKIVQITSENSWTVQASDPWILPSINSGINSSSFTVNIDTTGLVAATHQGTIIITEGSATKEIDITLTISDGNTSEQYLYVNPSEIEFIRNVNSPYAKTTNIGINSSESWIATKTANWLVLSQTSGSSGSDTIIASTNLTGLTEGVYAAEIAISHGDFIRKIYATLRLFDLSLEAPNSNQLYFSEENISLIMSSEQEASVLKVDFSTQTTTDHLLYQKKAPFFQGKATVNIGEEISDILKPAELPNLLNTQAVSLFSPATINITAYEEGYFDGKTYDSLERSNLFFINGKKPTTQNRLSYIPQEIIVSPAAVISFSIYKEIPPTEVVVTGAITESFPTNLTGDTKIYTLILDLSNYNLKYKDAINIDFGGHTLAVKIKQPDVESVVLAYENEWKLPEFIELTGELKITASANFSTHKTQVGKTIHERILKAEPGTTFSINSSWIYSVAETDWLMKLFNSKRMYLYINKSKTEVIPTFTKQDIYQTQQAQKTYTLTFKKAIL